MIRLLTTLCFGAGCFLTGLILGSAPTHAVASILPEQVAGMRTAEGWEALSRGLEVVTGRYLGLGDNQTRVKMWRGVNGRTITGTLVRVDGDTVTIRGSDHVLYRTDLDHLTPEDRVLCLLMKP